MHLGIDFCAKLLVRFGAGRADATAYWLRIEMVGLAQPRLRIGCRLGIPNRQPNWSERRVAHVKEREVWTGRIGSVISAEDLLFALAHCEQTRSPIGCVLGTVWIASASAAQ